MNFNLRRVSDFADCILEEGSSTIQFGFLNHSEAKELLESFKNAVEELEWFVRVTDKGEA